MSMQSMALIVGFSFLAISCSTTPESTGFQRKLTVYSENTRESRFEWKGKLSVEKDSDGRYTLVAPELMKGLPIYGSLYWPENAPSPKKLDPAADHELSFLECAADPPRMNYPWISLLKVSKNGKTLYDASVCKVHGRAMTRAYLEKLSDQGYDYSFAVRKRRSFPNDGFEYPSMHYSPVTIPQWRCPSCHAAFLRWKKGHGLDRPSGR